MNYLTNVKPNRSFSQKRIPEKRGKIMSSFEVSKVSSQSKLKISPEKLKKSQELLFKGKELLSSKNYNEAVKAFSDALKANECNYEAMFYRAIIYLDIGNPSKTISELNKIIERAPNFKNTIHLVLSMSYLRVGNIMASLKVLSKAIKRYPKFTEAYLARGQIYTILSKQTDHGVPKHTLTMYIINDYQKVIDLMPGKGMGHMGKGDFLKSIGDYSGALDGYTMAINLDEGQELDQSYDQAKHVAVIPRFKRARLLYQLKMFEQALTDLQAIIYAEPENSSAHFYTGKILAKQDPHSEAILHFEQVVKYSGEAFLSCNALLEVAKLRIKERDFYEAHYSLKRISLFSFKSAKLDQYQTFTEGVLYLIKRKIKKGVQLLTSLIDNSGSKATSSATTLKPKKTHESRILSTSTLRADQANKDCLHYFLKPLVYIYRAYGYITMEQYEKAIIDLTTASKLTKLDSCSVYNKQLALGFSRLQKRFNEEAQTIFKKAAVGDFKKNKEPYLLHVISVISSVTYSDNQNDIINVDSAQKQKSVNTAIQVLNHAIGINPEDLTLYYYRGLLHYYLHEFFDAFLDFNYIICRDVSHHFITSFSTNFC